LNKINVHNRFPIPRIDDLLDQLQGAKYFTTLDLLSGYHQLRLPEADIPKTAFRTPFGLYEYCCLTFGLTNAPSIFQLVMNDIFREYIGDFVTIYLDDIMIFSKTPEEHVRHTELVFKLLREHKLYLRLSKCHFNKPEVAYLGHIIFAHGISVDTEKTKVVDEWPVPTNVTELRSFLGYGNYICCLEGRLGGQSFCLSIASSVCISLVV
jgi:hypothetical protein